MIDKTVELFIYLGVLLLSIISNVIIAVKKGKGIKMKGNAYDEMYDYVMAAVEVAERTYDAFKSATNLEVGALKYDYVINKAQIYAINCGLKFDVEYWEKEIERLISFSKRVNYDKNDDDEFISDAEIQSTK